MDVLVLCADLDDGGARLGRRTIARANVAALYASRIKNAVVVSATGSSKIHPNLAGDVSLMVAKHITTRGQAALSLSGALEHTTKGELARYFAEARNQPLVVVSGWYHLPRVFAIVWQQQGFKRAWAVKYVSAPGDNAFWRAGLRELLAWVKFMTPKQVHELGHKTVDLLFGKALDG